MTRIGIKAIGFANGEECPHAGQWLQDFDFNAYDGQGFGEFTSDPQKAKAFGNPAAAWDYWQTTSAVKPKREDGKPNRPLTSLTISIESLDK